MGLDRHSGVMATKPGAMEDLRNFRVRAGKLEMRRGTTLASMLPAQDGEACSSVPLIQSLPAQQEGVAIGYYAGSRAVHVYRIGATAVDPVHIGKWFNLDAHAISPPQFSAVESYGQAFLAHDEPSVGRRAPTQVYSAIKGTIEDLTFEIGGKRTQIRFRGVETWLNYLLGWGFGVGNDERPEIVRVSLPAEPAVFEPDHYWIIGDRGSPVTTVNPAGSSIVFAKPAESWYGVGTSHFDFGARPLSELFGCLSPRLAVTVEKVFYAWGFEGPWATTIATADDLEVDLDLDRLHPEDLPRASPPHHAFALYLPSERVIEWHWGRRIYALDLEGRKWSYRDRPFQAACGALLYSRGDQIAFGDDEPVPEGYPEIVSYTGRGPTATITWRNVGQSGNEVLEVWIRRGRFSWSERHPGQDVTLNDRQSFQIEELTPGQTYTVAVRYRRGGKYAEEYRSEDPDSWPSRSRSTFTVTPAAPVLQSVVWARLSPNVERVLGTFTPAPGQERLPHQARRASDPGGTIPIPAGETTFEDTGIRGDAMEAYVVATEARGATSPASNELSVYTGPPAPTAARWRAAFSSRGDGDDILIGWDVRWTNAEAAGTRAFEELKTEIEVEGVATEVVPAGANKVFVQLAIPGSASEAQSIRVRHFTGDIDDRVYDRSEWVGAVAT